MDATALDRMLPAFCPPRNILASVFTRPPVLPLPFPVLVPSSRFPAPPSRFVMPGANFMAVNAIARFFSTLTTCGPWSSR